jgi:hypothetical protein
VFTSRPEKRRDDLEKHTFHTRVYVLKWICVFRPAGWPEKRRNDLKTLYNPHPRFFLHSDLHDIWNVFILQPAGQPQKTLGQTEKHTFYARV